MATHKTPDQIRRETVPLKHYGITYAFLGLFGGALLWFGGWALFHQEQVRRYPAFVRAAFEMETGSFSLLPKPKSASLSSAALRYALLRHGNQDHRFDAEILRHGWYPRETDAATWLARYGAIPPVFAGNPLEVLQFPFVLTLVTTGLAAVFGIVQDFRYKRHLVAGIPFEGARVVTVEEYNAETQGDGMGYAVQPWKDR